MLLIELLTARPECAKLKITRAEQAGFDAPVWRALCEIRMDLDEGEKWVNRPRKT